MSKEMWAEMQNARHIRLYSISKNAEMKWAK